MKSAPFKTPPPEPLVAHEAESSSSLFPRYAMKKINTFLSMVLVSAAVQADQGTTPQIYSKSWKGSDRASTCQQAISLAESAATDLPKLQLQGKVEKLEKKCDCGEERAENFATKRTDKYWSCLGMVSFTVKR